MELELLCDYRDGGIHKDHLSAKDSSGNGNDLPLVIPPVRKDVTISKVVLTVREFSPPQTPCTG